MPVQVIDLRYFVKDKLNFGPGYNTTTISAGQLTNVIGINLEDIESQFDIQESPTYNAEGKYYVLVGFNKVGDGSVVGP